MEKSEIESLVLGIDFEAHDGFQRTVEKLTKILESERVKGWNEAITAAVKVAQEFDTSTINYEPKDSATKIRIASKIEALRKGYRIMKKIEKILVDGIR